MNNIDPTPTIGIISYYQGRPNTVFLQRYGTQVARPQAS